MSTFYLTMTTSYWITVAIVTLCGLAFLFVLRWLLKRYEKKNQKSVNQDSYPDAVPTSSPYDDPTQMAQDTRRKSLRFRFSIIRHLLTLAIIFIALGAVLVPQLHHIPATLLSVLIASSGIIVGIAARPFIENLIAGIVITFSQHLRIGDTVQIDQYYGTIEDITPIYTVIKSWDWRRYVIPNADMLAKEFVSLTLKDSYRWMHVVFWVAPQADLSRLETAAVEMARQCPHFVDHEDPSFWVMEIEKEATQIWLAAWADTPGDAWMLASEMRTGLAKLFQEMGIDRHSYRIDFQPPGSAPSAPDSS